jgi:hypothetical protein
MTPQFLEIIEVRNGGGEWHTRVFVGMDDTGSHYLVARTYDDECAAALGTEYEVDRLKKCDSLTAKPSHIVR